MRKTSTFYLVSSLLFILSKGTEGTDAITHINCSPDGKYISVCERNREGEKGLLTIFEIIT